MKWWIGIGFLVHLNDERTWETISRFNQFKSGLTRLTFWNRERIHVKDSMQSDIYHDGNHHSSYPTTIRQPPIWIGISVMLLLIAKQMCDICICYDENNHIRQWAVSVQFPLNVIPGRTAHANKKGPSTELHPWECRQNLEWITRYGDPEAIRVASGVMAIQMSGERMTSNYETHLMSESGHVMEFQQTRWSDNH
jgi:hypothetical protein